MLFFDNVCVNGVIRTTYISLKNNILSDSAYLLKETKRTYF